MLLSYAKLQLDLFKSKFMNEENGAVDLIVIIILVAIAIALIVVFRNKLTELIGKMFGSIDADTNGITSLSITPKDPRLNS